MLFLLIASLVLIYSESFTIDFPYDVKFMAKISNINLLKINEDEKSELQYLFRTTPVLVLSLIHI